MKSSKSYSKSLATFSVGVMAVSLSLSAMAASTAVDADNKQITPISAASSASATNDLTRQEAASKTNSKKMRLNGPIRGGEEVQTGTIKPGPGPTPPPVVPPTNSKRLATTEPVSKANAKQNRLSGPTRGEEVQTGTIKPGPGPTPPPVVPPNAGKSVVKSNLVTAPRTKADLSKTDLAAPAMELNKSANK